MRFFVTWLLAFAVPTFFVRWLCGFAGHWFPRGAEVVFWVFAVLWLFASLQFALAYTLERLNRALGLNTPW